MELNDPQLVAAMHTRGALLVFAGAGSGKTRVITYRIANLVATEHVAPYRILAVTFTNKAAGEMRHRLEGMLGTDIARDLWVGTFHATSAKLLRRFGTPVGVSSNFLIYDSADQRAIVTRIVRDFHLDERRYPPRAMLSRILGEKQEGRGPEDMAMDSYLDEAAQRIYVEYDKRLRAANAVDFEDLILLMVRLAESDTPEGRTVRGKFSHVLVDEFQDTNKMQYALLRALVRETGNLMVVGDDDQSIYRWRGADVRNIRGFRHDFDGAQVVKLEQNYRSTKRIVESALAVIKPSRQREPKELWTDNDEGDKIRVVAVADERDEAAVVVDVIRKARETNVKLSEIAVFYRVHAQSRVLEEAMRAANFPYQIVGGMKFFDRAEVKDALSYLRLLVNPTSDVDFLRVVNSPARGIGDTAKERLAGAAQREGVSLYHAIASLADAGPNAPPVSERAPRSRKPKAEQATLDLEPVPETPAPFLFDLDAIAAGQGAGAAPAPAEAVRESAPRSSRRRPTAAKSVTAKDGELGAPQRKKLVQFYSMMESIKDDARDLGPAEVLDAILDRSGFRTALEADDSAEAEARLENLGELRGSLVDYEIAARSAGEEPSVEGFLERVSLVSDTDEKAGPEGDDGKVTLMTVHGAKGLEFECVALTGMEEDLFPYRGMNQGGGMDDEELDEERRLAYVAITRARRHLTITHASQRQIFGQTRYGAASRFLRELPPRHVEELQTGAAASQTRYVDRTDRTQVDRSDRMQGRSAQKQEPVREPGERYVDREYFDDVPGEAAPPKRAPGMPAPAAGSGPTLRRGMKVIHARFGEGEVRDVVHLGEPAAVAFFPGWGEMKVLARFLRAAT